MPHLNVVEVQRTILEKKRKKYEAFEKVVELCNRKIKAAAEQEHLRTFLVVPEFIVGAPIFNMSECLEFVINTLKKNGFIVRYYFPKMLYVSWDVDEMKEDKKVTVQVQKPKALLTSNITTNRNGKLILSL